MTFSQLKSAEKKDSMKDNLLSVVVMACNELVVMLSPGENV